MYFHYDMLLGHPSLTSIETQIDNLLVGPSDLVVLSL
jgi:hypothetical protein